MEKLKHRWVKFRQLKMGSLNSKIEAKLFEQGASLVGFADVSGLPADVRNSLNRAVSIAVALDAEIISRIKQGPTAEYFAEYKRVNELLSKLAENTAEILQSKGFRAVAMPPTRKKLDREKLATPLPHKTVATLAGLGWVGKCALLITEKYGSAVRLVTVLTDAELQIGEPINESQCGDCNKCAQACPAHAIKANQWQSGIEREVLVDAFACCDTATELASKVGSASPICGICINACPWTQKYIQREKRD